MDEQFKRSIDTLITERNGKILGEFRQEHSGHSILKEEIKQAKQNLKSAVSSDIWQNINELVAMLILERNNETLYSYVNGLRDSMTVWHYCGGEFIDTNYIELRSEIDKLKDDIGKSEGI